MGELFYKIKQFAESAMLNFHGNMLRIKHNTVLIIVYIGRILEAPAAVLNRHRNYTVILSCRMVDTSGISFILHTQQAFGISALLCIFSRRNGFRIFLRFGKVYGNIHFSVRGLCFPFYIFYNPVTADIVAVLA